MGLVTMMSTLLIILLVSFGPMNSEVPNETCASFCGSISRSGICREEAGLKAVPSPLCPTGQTCHCLKPGDAPSLPLLHNSPPDVPVPADPPTEPEPLPEAEA